MQQIKHNKAHVITIVMVECDYCNSCTGVFEPYTVFLKKTGQVLNFCTEMCRGLFLSESVNGRYQDS